ncbi:MAG: caspase family protein, partial [Deltaproteobacteria bacterium]
MSVRSWLTMLIALIATFSPLTAAPSQGKRVALVIGNSAYENTPALANPRNDADDMAAVLQTLGFDVIKGVDLKKTEMERSIRDFASALVGAEMGLFFYAGHGLQVSGINYLVPTDAVLTTASALDFEMVRLDLIQRTMESETQTNVIMLDACRDNPLSRNLARALGTRSASIGRGLGQFEAGVGTLISFSTQPGNVALDGSGRNSPYTGALVKHLATPAEDLTSVLIRVRNDVISSTASRQVPWDQHALRQPIFLSGRGAASSPVPQVEKSRESDEIAQAWAATKDSTSIAVLQAFAERYRQTFYGEMADARIAEL